MANKSRKDTEPESTNQPRISMVALSEVRRWPRNPKTHDGEALASSLDRFGFVSPLLLDESTGMLVAGHGRLVALESRKAAGLPPPARILVRESDGEWLVPVITGIAFRSQEEAEAYALADNRLVEVGGWDESLLAPLLSEIRDGGADFAALGWTDSQVDALIAFHDMSVSAGAGAIPGYSDDGIVSGDNSVLGGQDYEPPPGAPRLVVECDTDEQVRALKAFLGLDPDEKRVRFKFSEVRGPVVMD